MSDSNRLLAVMGGGDWHDASVDHVLAPVSLDINAAHGRWRDWYDNEYCGQSYHAVKRPDGMRYLSFPEWLVEREGCARATDDDVLEIWDV